MRLRRLFMLAVLLSASVARGQQPTGTVINFVDTRLVDVIRSIASTLGLNVVFNQVPDRRISFSTNVPVPREQLGGVLESILESNGLVLVRKGIVAQVFPADSAPPTGQVRFGAEIEDPPPLGLITQLIPLQSISAAEGAAALKPIASTTARIEPVPRNNSLLVTDRGVNVSRYLEILRRLDASPQGESGLRTYVVQLRYANADDLAYSLGSLYGVAVASQRGGSLDDLSLSRNLDVYRRREMDMFRLRPDVTQTVPVTQQQATPRDTTGAPTRPGSLVGQTTIVPSPPTNSLIIRTAPPNYPLLRETIDSLDTRPSQVLFEVTVAEVTLSKDDQFGIDWSFVGGSTSVQSGAPNAAPPDSSSLRDFVVRVVTFKNADVRAVLRALASKSQVRVLSTPEVLAVNNREARILVGSRVPFIASTRLGLDVAVDRSVQYENVGTTLTIVPTINQDDYVSVQILQEVSQLTSQTIRAALDAPVISTREASTRAIIRDGQTVVIGGLIGHQREDIESGVPFLKDIPLLGNLFKHRSLTRSQNELAIFVTPYIVRSDQDADVIRERIRRRMERQDPGALKPDTGTVRNR
jgi:general secretion pathway protein D